jgi:hypothetical protein
MKPFYFIISSIIAVLNLSSCDRWETVYCSPKAFQLELIGFDSAEVRQLDIMSYTKNGRFDTFVDSVQWEVVYFTAVGAYYNAFPSGDTLFINTQHVDSKHDYIITTHPKMKTWRLTEVSHGESSRQELVGSGPQTEFSCPLSSFYVDGEKGTSGSIQLKR